MVFNTLSDMMSLIRVLESVTTSVYVLDSNCNQMVYGSFKESDDAANLENLGSELPDLHTTFHSNLSFSVSCVNSVVSTITKIPIVINKKSCFLILVQHPKKDGHAGCSGEPADGHGTAFTDFLTKLYNRRYIDERLPIDMQSCFELDQPLSILFIDIDYFKNVNDQNGHVAGDQVLREISLLLQKHLSKKSGWIARYGGDEILICLPGRGSYFARGMAHRIRDSIENHVFCLGGEHVTITCSIGVQTVYKNSGITNISELIALADKKLYNAKHAGRNKVF